MNKTLMHEVRDHIAAHDDQFDMGFYIAVRDDDGEPTEDDSDLIMERGADCDTVCCIAGWAVMLDVRENHNADDYVGKPWPDAGCLALDLPHNGTMWVGHPLFQVTHWPEWLPRFWTRDHQAGALLLLDLMLDDRDPWAMTPDEVKQWQEEVT